MARLRDLGGPGLSAINQARGMMARAEKKAAPILDNVDTIAALVADLVEKAAGVALTRGRFDFDLAYKRPTTIRVSIPLTLAEADDQADGEPTTETEP